MENKREKKGNQIAYRLNSRYKNSSLCENKQKLKKFSIFLALLMFFAFVEKRNNMETVVF